MLELKDVILNRQHEGLLQPTSLIAREGAVSILTGKKESGKTWLLKAIMGLAPHEAGYISIDGEVITPLSAPYYRQRMAYVPQLIPSVPMTVGEMLKTLWGLHINAEKPFHRTDIRKRWQQLDLDSSLWDSVVSQLTLPTLRRILLSVTPLLGRPIILADMPFLGQSESQAALVESFLRQMADEGKIVVITTESGSPKRPID